MGTSDGKIVVSYEVPEFKFALRQDLKNNKEFLPQKSDPNATGWDVRCAEPEGVTLYKQEYKLIRLGIRVFSPNGWWLKLYPRSSSFIKKKLNVLYGVIDENYENELMFACQYNPDNSYLVGSLHIEFGERVGQIIPVRRQEMKVTEVSNEELDSALFKERNDVRGTGGFGSTG